MVTSTASAPGKAQTCPSSSPHPLMTPTSPHGKTALQTAPKALPDLTSPSPPRLSHLPQSQPHSPPYCSLSRTLPQRAQGSILHLLQDGSDVTFPVMWTLSTLFKTETSPLYPGSFPTQGPPPPPRALFIFNILYSDGFIHYAS